MNVTANDPFPQIAGYEFIRRLGRGGMADVYLCTQLSLSRPVAIKVLTAERTAGEDTVARFEHEARTIARLDHPDIVSIYDVGRTADGRLYYTMPYLARGDLGARDFHDDENAIATVVRALCRALAYAHDLGVVHRDVKPENILFDNLDRPLLADFGIALSTRNLVRVTREGSTIGSSGYASPEQARGLALDGRSDLYSLGVVTFEMLSGDLPLHGVDTLSMALAHVEQPIPRLLGSRQRWQAFIDKAMAKRPADRFQSAQEMEAAIDVVVTAPGARTAADRGSPRPRFGLVGAGIAIATVAAILALIILRPNSAPSSNAQQASAAEPESAIDAATATPTLASTGTATQANDATVPSLPAVETAADTPSAATAFEPGTPLRDGDGPQLVYVPAAHEGSGQGFALARYEVTRAEYAVFASSSGRGASKCREPRQPLSRFKKLSWRNPGFVQK